MAEDLKWELTILEVVHGFYLSLLQSATQDAVPVPYGVDAESLHDPNADLANSVANLRRWLKLLDLAVTPAMVRETLTENIDQDLAEALLRYYARKRSHSDFDRDKADFVATYLYRKPRVPGQWEMKGYSLDGVGIVSPFEISLLEVIGDGELPELEMEDERVINEFEFLRQEVEHFTHFEEITDSGIVARARQLKQQLKEGFYHPHALSAIAVYNASFGKMFDLLFQAATQHIQKFADQAVSPSAAVHGDVTVDHLKRVEAHKIMRAEYRHAQEHFRHVAKLKKAVDAKLKPLPMVAEIVPEQPTRPATTEPQAVAPAAVAETSPQIDHRLALAIPVGAPKLNEKVEEGKLQTVEDSIRAFVRAANPKFRQIVPMKFGNFTLTAAEADAYCADHLEETSFRADNARSLVKLVAVNARLSTELEELKHKQNSTHLWKPHAESVNYLETRAKEFLAEGSRVATVAQQRGLMEKAAALKGSMQRLEQKFEEVQKVVGELSARPA